MQDIIPRDVPVGEAMALLAGLLVIRQRKELQKDKAIEETISELAKLKALLDAL